MGITLGDASLTPGNLTSTLVTTLLLDHLISAADGTGVYPASVANDSILAMLMSKSGTAAASDYNNTTDSLQAQRDNFDGVIGAINTAAAAGAATDTDLAMAYLKQLVTDIYRLTEAADGTDKYPASWAEDSALAKLATKSDPAVISGYDNTTDSLEMLSDKLGGFSGDGGAAADDSVKAILDLMKVGTDLLDTADTAATHDVTTANDTVETDLFEISKTTRYAMSAYVDVYALVNAAEGGTVTFRLYNKIDETNYRLVASSAFIVGTTLVYPSFEVNRINHGSKVTIQCDGEVTTTRTINYRYITQDLE